MTFQDFAQHLLAGGDRGSRRAGRTMRRDMLSMERKFGPGIPGWWASPGASLQTPLRLVSPRRVSGTSQFINVSRLALKTQ